MVLNIAERVLVAGNGAKGRRASVKKGSLTVKERRDKIANRIIILRKII